MSARLALAGRPIVGPAQTAAGALALAAPVAAASHDNPGWRAGEDSDSSLGGEEDASDAAGGGGRDDRDVPPCYKVRALMLRPACCRHAWRFCRSRPPPPPPCMCGV
jgi:hypothetical protein